MKRFLVLFTVSVFLISCMSFFIPIYEYNDIYTDIIRLHVIANSDSQRDQELKLSVRDEILSAVSDCVEGVNDTEDALALLSENIDNLNECARQVITEKGFEYDVKTALSVEYYPTRTYEDATLPCGEYNSLRIVIGEGEGQNWWCVLFPPVCTGSASVKEELNETGFTADQIRLITDTDSKEYNVKFKCVEYLSSMKQKIKKLFS